MALQASPPRETQVSGHAKQSLGEVDPVLEDFPAGQLEHIERLSLEEYFPIGHTRQPEAPPEPNWPFRHAVHPSTPEVPEYRRSEPGGHPPEAAKSIPHVCVVSSWEDESGPLPKPDGQRLHSGMSELDVSTWTNAMLLSIFNLPGPNIPGAQRHSSTCSATLWTMV